MSYIGDFNTNQTVRFFFPSTNANGTPTALNNGSLAVFKDGSNTPITANVTLTASFGGRAGYNLGAIEMSGNTSVYTAGSDFALALTAGDVDSVSVANSSLCQWSVNNRAGTTTTQLGHITNANTTITNANTTITTANTTITNANTTITNANTTITAANTTVTTANTTIANANTTVSSLNTTLLGASFIETNVSLKSAIRMIGAATAGKLTGSNTTTMNMTNFAGNATVISATVDSNGNRTVMTYNTSY